MALMRKDVAALMYPGLNSIIKDKTDPPGEFEAFFTRKGSDRAFEVEQGMAGFGLVPEKEEGVEALYDDPTMGWNKIYYHLTYALKFRVTQECIEDDQYNVVGNDMSGSLGASCRATQELLAAATLNNGFTDTNGTPDGLPLFSASHPLLGGGYYGNAPSVPAALSVTSLQNAINTLRGTVNERGILGAPYVGKTLIVPPALQFVAQNLMQAMGLIGSNNNDINTVKGKFDVSIYDYLTNPMSWYIAADKSMTGLKWYDRVKIVFKNYTENQTEDAVFGVRFRCSSGWSSWRGIYGTPGQ